MIKLVMCLGIFPIESVAMNFTDINECADGTSKCSADAMCNNTEGSYRCKCKPGFNGDGRTCNGKTEPCFMILIIINWILINVNVCCFLLVSSNKAADNCVFLKVINFMKMVGLKEVQLLNVLVKV